MYYRQPRYFGDFHCIGAECKDNCCYGWRIDWKKKEVEKLKNAPDIPPQLNELIEASFIPNEELEEYFEIKLDEHKKCPFNTEDGLCMIQRELGAEYLSNTCMTYPRNIRLTDNFMYRYCNISCRVIISKLISDPKAMDLINVPSKETKTIICYSDSKNDIANHPELKYRTEIFEFFYDLIGDKKHDLETNIILGALTAQSLTKLINQGEADRIPEALKSFRSQMHNGAQVRSIENIKPNYSLRFGFIEKLLSDIVGFSMVGSLNDNTGTPNIDYYNAASAKLNKLFEATPFYLRNIALNLLFETQVPFKLINNTILENYSLFVAIYACIKLNLIAIALVEDSININYLKQRFHYKNQDRFVGLTSIICRNICQNDHTQDNILKFLKDNNLTSPAYLALLVK